MKQDLVEIFRDTLHIGMTEFADSTEKLILNNTFVYFSDKWQDMLIDKTSCAMQVQFLQNTGTLEAAYKYVKEDNKDRCAVLNFADALEPGGLVWSGEVTQEENLCRCSNLYQSISSNAARPYYNTNLNSELMAPGLYTNTVIYSKDVIVFKDDKDYSRLRLPYLVDVITCPSPSCSLDKETALDLYVHRISCILNSAVVNEASTIILGAWGCGAFGQDPELMGMAFGIALNKMSIFKNVVFAIRSDGNNYKSLKKGFLSRYKGVIKTNE